MTKPKILRFKNLSVGWGGYEVFQNINLEINLEAFNRRLPLIGRTGLGKTTLLYAMAAQSLPLNGEIEWIFPVSDQRICVNPELKGSQAAKLRSRVFSFAFQDALLVPFLTVIENIEIPILQANSNSRWNKADIRRQARQLLEEVLVGSETIANLENRYPDQLSGGQRQRVSIAQSLATYPLVLFSDEPTGSLDPETRIEIMGVIDRWLEADTERVYIWITHHRDPFEFARTPYALLLDQQGDGPVRVHRRETSYFFTARQEGSSGRFVMPGARA